MRSQTNSDISCGFKSCSDWLKSLHCKIKEKAHDLVKCNKEKTSEKNKTIKFKLTGVIKYCDGS